jgi:hypothetical protein
MLDDMMYIVAPFAREKPHVPRIRGDEPSTSGFLPSANDLNKFLFKKRLNLELGMTSEIKFTKTDIENFAGQLIDIHQAHNIPISEIKIRVIM